MLDLDSHSVLTNGAYLLPAIPAVGLGPLVGGVVTGAALWLAWESGSYHTTYTRRDQAEDVAAMLTYLAALIGALASPWSPWALVLPLAAAPLHERYVWEIDSYVATPAYIAAALCVLALQVGVLPSLVPAGLALAGGAIKLAQPGPRSRLHSLWHVCGGLAAASAILVLSLYT